MKKKPSIRVYLSPGQKELAKFLRKGGFTSPDRALVLDEPVKIYQTLDSRHSYEESGMFLAERLYVSGRTPVASGRWAECPDKNRTETIELVSSSEDYPDRGEYFDATWNVGTLLWACQTTEKN